jgi:dTDP-4-amino-4,6-dideoxygalactose transaminase
MTRGEIHVNPYLIPFHRSSTVGRELQYIAETLLIGTIAGDQAFTRRCQRLLQEVLGVPRALITTSCTHALEMAGMLLDIGPGDEVIVPSFTFVSTANAFAVRGARPVFADIRADTLNLDESRLESLITPRTRAIVPVHYAGIGCDMDAIGDIARRHNLAVVEDNAHGLFGKYRGRNLGTLGRLATLSFHETKNITCGEGGALLINDPALVERAEIIREKGTNRSKFFRGEIDKYTWVDVGSSYVVSDVLAAFLFGQLEQWQRIQQRRREIWERYHAALPEWAAEQGVHLPVVPLDCEQAHHMYYLVFRSLSLRQGFIGHLKARRIAAVFHYLPLHLSAMGRQFGGQPGDCSVTESVSDRLVRLPFYNEMTAEEQEMVIAAIKEFRC